MKHLLQFNRFMVMLIAMLTLSVTSAWGQTYTFTSKAWADANNSWTSDKDGYQKVSSPSAIQVTSTYTGAGATSKASFTDITKISVMAYTTSKGIGNITVKVGDGTAQTICSLSKSSTAKDYSLEFATPVSGKVTFVVNCSTNSMYMQSITITSASGYDIEYECNDATSGCPEKATNQTALPDPLPTGVQKTGFNFAGWFTNEGLSTPAVAGAEITAKTTLYAKWDEIVTPTVSLDETTIDFGTVYQNAEVTAKTIGATLLNTSAATASITGSAFALNPTELSESGKITITPNTATIGEYSETLTLAATGATSATATIKMNVVEAPAPYDVEHDFTQISGFSSWGSSYTEHVVNYTDDKVVFASANKQTSTITNMPVTKGRPVSLVLTNAKKYISKVKFECTQWSSNAQTITLNYSKDGGETYSTLSPSVTSSTFTLESELPDSVNAVKFTFNNTTKQVGISKLSFNMVDRQLVSNAVTITAPEATQGTLEVKKGETTITSGSNATELDTLTIVATPKSGYKVSAISVKDADGQDVTVLDNNIFVMPAKAVTVSATFESAKVLTSVEITTPASKTEFWKGEEFTAEGLVLTAHFDGAEDAVVEPDSIVGYNMSVAGQQTVKVYYSEGVITKYAEYNINVKTIANTLETAYSVDSAIKLVQAGKDLATKVYVKGVITSISGQRNNNVFVKDAGLTNSFEFYGLTDGTTYKVEDLVVSDTIIGYGEMTYYAKSQIYEFKAGCTLEDRKAYVEIPCAIENTLETAYTVAEAIALIDQGECLESAQVYVKGVVTSISGSTTKDIVICDAGQSNSFKFYQIVDGGATVADVQLYDTIAAKGFLIKYQSTYELDANCTLEQIKAFVPHVLSVSLNTKATSIVANGSVQLTATVLPEEAQDKSVTWSVIEGGTLVSVDQTGLVSGLNAGEGTATVRVTTTDGGFTDDCVITVTAADLRKTASITGFTATEGALTPSDITYKGEQGGASTKAAIYNNGLRLYQNGGYVTIAAAKGCKIDEVIITTNATYSTTAAIATTRVKPTSGVSVAASSTKSFGTGMNVDTAFVFCLGTDKNTRLEIASIVVKYTGEPLAIDTIKVSGEYQTEFQINDEFNHDGAIVTAYYSDQITTAVVTEGATFSDPDMTTTGEKTVTVTYAGKQTSYTINVVPATLDTIKVTGNYQKVFAKDDTFNHDGAVVTAYYSDETFADVTADAEFIAPDMTTYGGKQVVVNYGGKSTSYAISVKCQSGDMKSELVDFTVVYASVTSNKEVEPYSGTSFDMDFKKKTGTNTPIKYYNEGTSVRNYTGDTIIISAVDNIYMVEIQFTDIKGIDTNPTVSEGTMTIDETSKLATWILSGTSKEVRYICGSTSSFSTIKVWYARPYVRESTVAGNYGVVCLPMAVAAGDFQGAEVFKIVEKDADVKNLTIETVESMEAGHAYIILSNAENFTCMMTGDAVTTAVAAADNYGLAGTLTGTSFTGDGSQYVIVNNKVMKAGQVNIGKNKAWIEMDDVPAAGQGAPQRVGSRRITLGSNESQVVTGLDALFIQEGIQKMIVNGQLIIVKDGKMFNAQGQIVK